MTGNDGIDNGNGNGNGNGHDEAHDDARLRWQLRGMRRDLPMKQDLWPGIAARIASQGATASSVRPSRDRAMRRWAPLALAASLLLAVGLTWQSHPLPEAMTPAAVGEAHSSAQLSSATVLPREAEAMAREYDAALLELHAGTPRAPRPHVETAALQDLDRSADQIRDALRRDPDARFLFERLRRTYAQRLALTRRSTLT